MHKTEGYCPELGRTEGGQRGDGSWDAFPAEGYCPELGWTDSGQRGGGSWDASPAG